MDTSHFATIHQVDRHPNTSAAYRFIPTSRVLAVLSDHGWHPVGVQESRTRRAEYRGFQRHLVRLQSEAHRPEAGSRPELVLINAHDGNAAFRLLAGVYELVCCNGLIVGATVTAEAIRHVGFADRLVSEAVTRLVGQLPRVLGAREQWQCTRLDGPARQEFARRALELRFEPGRWDIDPGLVLLPRHAKQATSTLWDTFNVVQENLIRGDLLRFSATGRVSRSQPLRNIPEEVRMNRHLWDLAEEFAARA